MDKLEGELPAANDDVEACRVEKKHHRRRILYNLFDFLAIVMSNEICMEGIVIVMLFSI